MCRFEQRLFLNNTCTAPDESQYLKMVSPPVNFSQVFIGQKFMFVDVRRPGVLLELEKDYEDPRSITCRSMRR